MELEILIGYVAAFLTTVSFIPQVVQIYKTKNTDSISGLMYLIFCFGVALWLFYGVIISSMPVIIANSITLVLSLYILVMKLKNKTK
jgi:MtN3 and saliva related transmembrane protein